MERIGSQQVGRTESGSFYEKQKLETSMPSCLLPQTMANSSLGQQPLSRLLSCLTSIVSDMFQV